MQKNNVMFLDKLKVGQTAKVVRILIDNLKQKKRFFDMGLTTGVVVKMKKVAPLGDPISIELRGYELCVRKQEVKDVEVEIIL